MMTISKHSAGNETTPKFGDSVLPRPGSESVQVDLSQLRVLKSSKVDSADLNHRILRPQSVGFTISRLEIFRLLKKRSLRFPSLSDAEFENGVTKSSVFAVQGRSRRPTAFFLDILSREDGTTVLLCIFVSAKNGVEREREREGRRMVRLE
jgi:hypothetical protein